MSDINKDLLAAAKAVLSNKRGEADWLILSTHCENLEDAIAAAERELAERLKPIDDVWLSKLFYIQPGRGFVVGRLLSIFNTKTGHHLFAGPEGANDSDDTFKISDVLKNRGQLLDLLSGLGIEVAK